MALVDRDRGWSQLAKTIKSLAGGPHVLVGVQGAQAGAQHGSGGVTTLEVACWNEFGTSKIPARSFVRETVEINEAKLLALAAKVGQRAALGALAPGQALELLGEYTVGLMKERISDRIPPPNAASTIARKGSSTPLIAHTGQLRNSISYLPGGVG
jgi:hypothetical protein